MPNPITVVDLDGLRYYNTKMDAKFANKVDKVDGKGLSSNDYTNSEQSKLSNIEANAQVNKIEAISVNGTAQTITAKGVNISVPTNNNQLTNGAGYQTASDVNSLISTAIANAHKISKELVDTLPTTGQDNIIYLVPNGSSGNNAKDEYMWINNAWERVGSSDVDLSGYLQTTDVVSITNAQIDNIVGNN